MALITTIKRCLGFGVTDDEEDYEALAAEALHAGIATPPFHEPDKTSSDMEPHPSREIPITSPNEGAAQLSELLIEIVRQSMASPRFTAELSRYSSGSPEEFQNERAKLLDEIKKLKEQSASTSMLTTEINNLRLSSQRQQRAYTDRINELMEQINRQAGKQPSHSDLPDPLIAELQNQLNSREKTIKDLNETISALTLKVKMSDEMINSLNKKAAEARSELKAASLRYEEQIDLLEGRLSDANASIESLKTRLEMVAHEQQLPPMSAADDSAKKGGRGRKKKNRDNNKATESINAIDPALNDTSWLVSEPDGTTKERNSKNKQDSDFGYIEPVRKDSSDYDERQMSLF